MRCRKCKQIKDISESIVHKKETHGLSFEMQKFYNPNLESLDWKLIEALYQKHRDTGKQGKFKNKLNEM